MNRDDSEAFETAFQTVLRHTPEITERPELAKYGVSLALYPELGAERLRALTLDEAKAIHFIELWRRARIGDLPSEVSDKVLDTAIWLAPAIAITLLQIVLNRLGLQLHVDGKIGEATLHAARSADRAALLAHYRHAILVRVRSLTGRRVELEHLEARARA